MKIIQVNIQRFRYFEKLYEFLERENADIVTMQEVAEWILCEHPTIDSGHIDQITQGLGYDFFLADAFGVKSKSWAIWNHGNMILSKHPIVDTHIHWTQRLGKYRVVDDTSLGMDIDNTLPWAKYKKYVLWQDLPVVIAETVCKISEDQFVRVLTTHMTASPACTETLMMRHHSKTISDILDQSKKIPTIVAGDFNIRPDSWTVQNLKKNMHMIIDQHTNSLNHHVHPWFKYDIPDSGYQVDHIFTRGFQSIDRRIDSEITVSDHFPVIATIEPSV